MINSVFLHIFFWNIKHSLMFMNMKQLRSRMKHNFSCNFRIRLCMETCSLLPFEMSPWISHKYKRRPCHNAKMSREISTVAIFRRYLNGYKLPTIKWKRLGTNWRLARPDFFVFEFWIIFAAAYANFRIQWFVMECLDISSGTKGLTGIVYRGCREIYCDLPSLPLWNK